MFNVDTDPSDLSSDASVGLMVCGMEFGIDSGVFVGEGV